MSYSENFRPGLKTFRNLMLSGVLALGCGAMAAGCSSVSNWWHGRSGMGQSTSYNSPSSNYGSSSSYSGAQSSAGSQAAMNTSSSTQSAASAAPGNGAATPAAGTNAESTQPPAGRNMANNANMANNPSMAGSNESMGAESHMNEMRHGRHSSRWATHWANEQEARAAAEELAPRLKNDISRAQSKGAPVNEARNLYQRGQEALNSGRPVQALCDFNRAERTLGREMNTTASAAMTHR